MLEEVVALQKVRLGVKALELGKVGKGGQGRRGCSGSARWRKVSTGVAAVIRVVVCAGAWMGRNFTGGREDGRVLVRRCIKAVMEGVAGGAWSGHAAAVGLSSGRLP